MKIDTIPHGFIDRADSPEDEYYPTDVTDATQVEVIINHGGILTRHRGAAQSFGWTKRPAMPGYSGLSPVAAPITHYRILFA